LLSPRSDPCEFDALRLFLEICPEGQYRYREPSVRNAKKDILARCIRSRPPDHTIEVVSKLDRRLSDRKTAGPENITGYRTAVLRGYLED
jgi:hypothetical protein